MPPSASRIFSARQAALAISKWNKAADKVFPGADGRWTRSPAGVVPANGGRSAGTVELGIGAGPRRSRSGVFQKMTDCFRVEGTTSPAD